MSLFYIYAFIEVYAVPIALKKGLTKIFVWFIFGHIWVIFVVVFLAKETKGLSLEQIDILWASEEYKSQNAEASIIESYEVIGVGKGKAMVEKDVEVGEKM